MRSTLLHAINISFHPRESLFKIYETIRVPFFQSSKRSFPPLLIAFQGKIMLFGDMTKTSGNNLFLQFHKLLSFHGRCKPPFMECKKNPRRLSFTPNPQIRVGLIMRDCMKSTFPLYMIINKRGKGSQLYMVRARFHGTSHLMQIEFTK